MYQFSLVLIRSTSFSYFVLFILFLCLFCNFNFRIVYEICMWDDKGANKLLEALKDDILDFIRQAKMVGLANLKFAYSLIY